MSNENIDDGSAIDLERKRGISPWVIFSIALFVIGVVFGVRRARKAKPPALDGNGAGEGSPS